MYKLRSFNSQYEGQKDILHGVTHTWRISICVAKGREGRGLWPTDTTYTLLFLSIFSPETFLPPFLPPKGQRQINIFKNPYTIFKK